MGWNTEESENPSDGYSMVSAQCEGVWFTDFDCAIIMETEVFNLEKPDTFFEKVGRAPPGALEGIRCPRKRVGTG